MPNLWKNRESGECRKESFGNTDVGNELFNCPPYVFVIVLFHSSGKKPFINRLNVVKKYIRFKII